MNCEAIISIHGVPRSGTSWLGEIFNSHPEVAYRFQPLFSYAFRDAISENSTFENLQGFFSRLIESQDDFVLQRNGKEIGQRINFDKSHVRYLVMKHVRFHHLVWNLLQMEKLKIVYIFRHPCGVIHSWLSSPERKSEWPVEEWRWAKMKNANGPEEWNGFEKWKEAMRQFQNLKKRFPQRVYLCSYEKLVRKRHEETLNLFRFAFNQFQLPEQTSVFLNESDQKPLSGDSYGVFQSKALVSRWEWDLSKGIRDEILGELMADPGLLEIP